MSILAFVPVFRFSLLEIKTIVEPVLFLFVLELKELNLYFCFYQSISFHTFQHTFPLSWIVNTYVPPGGGYVHFPYFTKTLRLLFKDVLRAPSQIGKRNISQYKKRSSSPLKSPPASNKLLFQPCNVSSTSQLFLWLFSTLKHDVTEVIQHSAPRSRGLS